MHAQLPEEALMLAMELILVLLVGNVRCPCSPHVLDPGKEREETTGPVMEFRLMLRKQ